MYQIYFYEDKNKRKPVFDYLESLIKKNSKDSRIKANKINDYIQILSEYGTRAGVPYVKHLDDDIWELRPLRDRILFVAWDSEGFILLHVFQKKTQKTPKREIEQAKREYLDFLERKAKKNGEDDEQQQHDSEQTDNEHSDMGES